MGGICMLKVVSRKEALGMIDSIFTSFHFGLMSITDSGIENSWEREYFWTEANRVDQGRLTKEYEQTVSSLDAEGFNAYYKFIGEFAARYKIGCWEEYNQYEPIVIEELNDELGKHAKTEEKLELIDSFTVDELKSDAFIFDSKVQVLYDILDDSRVKDNKEKGINKVLSCFNSNDKAGFISKIQSDRHLLDALIDKVNGTEKDEMLALLGEMFISSGFIKDQKAVLLNNNKTDRVTATFKKGNINIDVKSPVPGGARDYATTKSKSITASPFDLIGLNYDGREIKVPALVLLAQSGNKDELYKKIDINNIPEEKIVESLKYSNVPEQYEILKSNVDTLNGTEKGSFAKKVRENKSVLKLNELFSEYPRFMNEDLRDFLNCKEDGTGNYSYTEIRNKHSEWKEYSTDKAACHQSHHLNFTLKNGIDIPLYNAKFVNDDGREAVFNANHTIILTYPDKGTYNYQNPDDNICSKKSLEHNKFDITPYYNYMKELAANERKQNIRNRLFKAYDNINIYNLIILDLCEKLISDGHNYQYKNLLTQLKATKEWKQLSKEEQKNVNLLFKKISANIKANQGELTNSEVWEIIDEYKKNINDISFDNYNRS